MQIIIQPAEKKIDLFAFLFINKIPFFVSIVFIYTKWLAPFFYKIFCIIKSRLFLFFSSLLSSLEYASNVCTIILACLYNLFLFLMITCFIQRLFSSTEKNYTRIIFTVTSLCENDGECYYYSFLLGELLLCFLLKFKILTV